MRVPNFIQIGPCAAELWRHIDFQDGGHQPCCIYFGVIADHPRSAFRGLNSFFKSLVRRINVSGDIAMYRFWRFGIHAPFGKLLGHIFPIWRHSSSRPPKGPSLGGNTSFNPFSVRISATVRPGRVNEKKCIICNVKFGDLGANGTGDKNSSSKVPYLESPTPICLFTMQLLWGYDDD